jgi:transketolase C-terminal domain/subunit
MRNAYLNTLYDLASHDENVLSLVSDNGLIVYDDFRRDFPKQYFNLVYQKEI